MAFVTDPDDLNRWQVAVDPVAATIELRGLGAVRSAKKTDGVTTISTGTFTSASADFVTDGVVTGDILTIVSGIGAVIGHYRVVTRDDLNTLTVEPVFAASKTGLTFRVSIPTPADGPQGGNLGDGVSLQCLYSFLKEEWRTFDTGIFNAGEAPDLINYIFPLESITREQFEIGGATHGSWDFANNRNGATVNVSRTRDIIRTGGWQQINSGGVAQKEYAGIITLGALDADAQVYYLQSVGGTPVNFVLTGSVNQAILVWTNGGDNFRAFLNLYVRKKGKTYAGSAIADIGVSSIETIVNRFPLAHVADPAIIVSDGVLKGDGTSPNEAFQSVALVDTKADGVVSDPTAGDGLFQLVSASSLFQTTNKVRPFDAVELTSGSDQGVYEIKTVDSETQLTLYQEPGVSTVGGSGVAFTTRTRTRNDGAADGVTADPTPDDGLGTFTSATVGNFATAGVIAGDMLEITTATTAANVGVYKITTVVTTTLTINIADNENWVAEGGATFRIQRKGMHLQYKKKTITLGATGNLTFADANPDTITRASGSWIDDGVKAGDNIVITGSVSNNGTYTVASRIALVATLVATDALVNEGPVAATATCYRGFVRTLNTVAYGFNWRQFGNLGTLAQNFQWIQRELRRATDINEASGTNRGDITALLQAFASPNTVTTNLVMDNVAATDLNNLTQGDATAVNRNDAFISSITISLNSNINNAATKKLNVYWTNTPNQFGTVDAVLVKDKDDANMTAADGQLNGASISFTYNYDASQNGHGGGAEENMTIVVIGTTYAQYGKTSGPVTEKNENTFALAPGLERNYSNP